MLTVGIVIVCWSGLVAFGAWVRTARIRPDDDLTALIVRVMQVYARSVHGLRVEGAGFVPQRGRLPDSGAAPLIVVANHTAFIDPILVQAALPFEVRWIMAKDMATPSAGWLWDLARVILVDRRSNDSAPLREAIRHLKSGGVVGVFPEGYIERPPRVVYPFQDGVGLLVARTGAAVLPVVIDGTPQVEDGSGALVTPSRSRVRFLAPIRYKDRGMSAAEIARDLRRVFVDATGWPTSDRTPRWENGAWTDIGLDGREIRRDLE